MNSPTLQLLVCLLSFYAVNTQTLEHIKHLKIYWLLTLTDSHSEQCLPPWLRSYFGKYIILGQPSHFWPQSLGPSDFIYSACCSSTPAVINQPPYGQLPRSAPRTVAASLRPCLNSGFGHRPATCWQMCQFFDGWRHSDHTACWLRFTLSQCCRERWFLR